MPSAVRDVAAGDGSARDVLASGRDLRDVHGNPLLKSGDYVSESGGDLPSVLGRDRARASVHMDDVNVIANHPVRFDVELLVDESLTLHLVFAFAFAQVSCRLSRVP